MLNLDLKIIKTQQQLRVVFLNLVIALTQAHQGSVEFKHCNNQNTATTKACSVQSRPWNNQNTARTKNSGDESGHWIDSITSR